MNIYIKRYHYSRWGVDGECFVGSQKACDSVEHPTAYLPDGEYPITKNNYRQYFIRGNGPMMNRQGEICVGRYALRGFVLQTAEAYFKLSKRILKALKKNEPITLKITSVKL